MMKKKLAAILIACLCVAEATTVVVPIAEPVTVMAATKAGTKQTKKKAPSLNKVYKAARKRRRRSIRRSPNMLTS